jgi:hypothetical protein
MNRYSFPMSATAIAISISAVLGCSQAPKRDRLAEAEQLVLEKNYAAAIPLIKQHLIETPYDTAGHFYLGRCYMEDKDDFWPRIAEGEFQTAFRLHKQSGATESPIARFKEPDYFPMMCQVNSGKVLLLQVTYLIEHGVGLERIQDLVLQAKHYVDLAREIRPNADEVREVDNLIRQLILKGSADPAFLESVLIATGPPIVLCYQDRRSVSRRPAD